MTEPVNEIVFRPAESSDWEKIAELLTKAKLPLAGAREHLPEFLLAFRGDELVGSAGLERYGAAGEDALLRSLAVADRERGRGLGSALVEKLLARARSERIARITLLTETAEPFFARFGFRRIARADAPESVRASVEFQSACPQSAAVMTLSPPAGNAEAPR